MQISHPRDFIADFSSISPSSEQTEGLWLVRVYVQKILMELRDWW